MISGFMLWSNTTLAHIIAWSPYHRFCCSYST